MFEDDIAKDKIMRYEHTHILYGPKHLNEGFAWETKNTINLILQVDKPISSVTLRNLSRLWWGVIHAKLTNIPWTTFILFLDTIPNILKL